MTPTQTIEYHLTLMGPLSLWISIPLCVVAIAASIWSLRRELAGKGRQGHRPWLLVFRSGSIVTLAFLALQPVLFVRREIRKPAPVVVVADRSLSMLRTDTYETTDLLNLVAGAGLKGFEDRATLPQQVHVRLLESRTQLQRAQQKMQAAYDQLSQGLPWGPAFTRLVEDESQRTTALLAALRKDQPQIASLETTGPASSNGTGKTTAVPPRSPPPDKPSASKALETAQNAVAAFLETLPNRGNQPPPPEKVFVILRQYEEQLRAFDQALQALVALQKWCDQLLWQTLPEEKRKGIADTGRLARFELSKRLTQRLSEDPALAQSYAFRLSGWEPLDPANASTETDLYELIDSAMATSAKESLSALVLVTDGCQNLPERPEILRRLAACKTPLVLAGVGRAATETDVAILDYTCPRLTLSQKTGRLKVSLKTSVPAGTPIKVDLQADGQSLAEQGVQADGTGRLGLDFEFRVPSESKAPWVLAARTETPDAFPDNNSVRIGVNVLQRPTPVLVIARAPRWDVAYLLRALAGKPCTVRSVFWGAAKKTPPGEDKNKPPLPGGIAQVQPYRLVVLDGDPWPGMSEQSATLFKEFVINGGSLVVMTDEKGRSVAPKLAALLGPAPTAAPSARSAPLQPASSAHLLPALALSADGARSIGLWRAFPLPSHVHPVGPQSMLLLLQAETPCLSLGFHGRGRVYWLGIGDLFRMREWKGGAAMSRFLSAMVEDSLVPLFGDSPANLAVYPSTPLVGSTARILLHGSTGGTVQAKLPDGRSSEVKLQGLGAGNLAMGSVRIPAEGVLELKTADGAQFSTPTVAPVMSENLYTGLDADFLNGIAEQTGGSFVPLSELGNKINTIQTRVNRQVDLREFRLWNLPGILLLLIVWLTVEWILRRRAGLVL